MKFSLKISSTAVAIAGFTGLFAVVPSQASWWHSKSQDKAKPAASAPAAQSVTPVAAAKPAAPAPVVAAKPATPAPVVAAKPAAQPAKAMAAKTAETKTFGTVESINSATDQLTIKTNAGKTESFSLAKSGEIFGNHKKLTLAGLKVGERVSVHANGESASRVYVLPSNKKA